MDLLSHQHKFINTIFDYLEDHNLIFAIGKSGCGKSYSFQWASENINLFGFEKVLIFDNDYFTEDQDYFPFKKALYMKDTNHVHYVKKGAIEAAKDTPFVGNFVSYIVSTILKPEVIVDNNLLSEEEQILVNHIKKTLRNKKSCIFCDNIHWWDRRSINLLLKLLDSQILSPKIKFVVSITSNQDNSNHTPINTLLKNANPNSIFEFPKFSYLEFKKYLYLKTTHNLTETQIELLYNLVDGHLKVFFEVIDEIQRNSFDFNSKFESNKTYLRNLLNKRLKECGATGDQIVNVLEYASIIGICFSGFELQQLTDYTKAKLKNIIENASKLRLTQSSSNTDEYRFSHDIIREIFKTRVDENHIDYYHTMALCLKEIKPSQYYRRAKYMLLAVNNEEAEVLFCLEMIAQLRLYGNISESTLDECKYIINQAHQEFIDYMTQAYDAYNNKLYDLALAKLNLILSYYSEELLAERDILKLRCFSKKLATDEISEEIKRLDKKRVTGFVSGEKEIYERYTHSLLTAYAHLGELSKSRELEEEVLISLSSRMDFDENAKLRLHVIKRNANAIHGIDTAPIFVKQAVQYFEKKDTNGEYINIKQYYTSLINHSALLIKQGEFSEAFNQTLIAFELEHENRDVTFPRTQILRSNWIIAGVLNEKLSPTDAIELYKSLLAQLPGILAEKLFYTSNLSIMYALNNDPEIALHLLQQEAQNHNIECDKEGIYKYRVETNCAIYKYLLGKKEEAIDILLHQDLYIKRLINGSFFQRKKDIIVNIMKQSNVYDGLSWLSSVQSVCPDFQGKPWRYFGKGYAFAALCDWGI